MDTKRTGCCTGYKAKLWESIARPDHSWISNERLPGTRKKNTQKSNLRRWKEWTKIIIIIIILEENDVMNVSIRSVTFNTFSLPPLLIFLRLFSPLSHFIVPSVLFRLSILVFFIRCRLFFVRPFYFVLFSPSLFNFFPSSSVSEPSSGKKTCREDDQICPERAQLLQVSSEGERERRGPVLLTK